MDEPLKPVGNFVFSTVPEPPWYSRAINAKKFDGKTRWWAAFDYRKNQMPPQKPDRWYQYYPRFGEEDILWYDAPVRDGTSLTGAFGKDALSTRNLSIKADHPGDFFEFQKKVMKESHQYKQIVDKFDISDEHPGIAVNPTLSSLNFMDNSRFGKFGDRLLTNSWGHYGPRFFDKPANEGCLEKGLAAVKFVSIFNIAYTAVHVVAYSPEDIIHGWRGSFYVRRYFSLLPLPSLLAFMYGTTWCASAAIRNRDDFKNFYIAGAIGGAILSSIKDNVAPGVMYMLLTSFVATSLHLFRLHSEGLQGRKMEQSTAGSFFMNGPLVWKYLHRGGDLPISEKKY